MKLPALCSAISTSLSKKLPLKKKVHHPKTPKALKAPNNPSHLWQKLLSLSNHSAEEKSTFRQNEKEEKLNFPPGFTIAALSAADHEATLESLICAEFAFANTQETT